MTTLCMADLYEPLPKITSQFTFYQLAKGRDVEVRTFEQACRFDLDLRRDKVGFVPSSLLRAWYRRGGR